MMGRTTLELRSLSQRYQPGDRQPRGGFGTGDCWGGCAVRAGEVGKNRARKLVEDMPTREGEARSVVSWKRA